MGTETFYWHDYETFGSDPRRDRPAQFAGIRTNRELEVVEEPDCFYCRPAEDDLPSPQACLVTGIRPSLAFEQGLPEHEFAARVLERLGQPGSCGIGYNSLKFDDEVTRFLLYRNFYEPYEREYADGNSRWDLINVLRLAYALRPQGLQWPLREDGRPSFRLQDLTAANDIEHSGAHDALADVRATIELARLLRGAQPRLYQWCEANRHRAAVERLLDPAAGQMVVHSSSRIGAQFGCTSLFMPMVPHPEYPRAVICYDLRCDPEALLDCEADAVAERVFSSSAELGDVARIPLKAIWTNRAPVVAPESVLRDADLQRIELDLARCRAHAERLRAAPDLPAKVRAAFSRPRPETGPQDPEEALYGGFFDAADRKLLRSFRGADAQQARDWETRFTDPRLRELAFRYRARVCPTSLTSAEQARWHDVRRSRLARPTADGEPRYLAWRRELEDSKGQCSSDEQRAVLDDVESWGERLLRELGLNDAITSQVD